MATRKSNPRVSEPQSEEPTPVSGWKKAVKGIPLKVPSGNVCMVRMPDSLKMFMGSGNIPNALLPVLEQALTGKAPDTEKLMAEAVKDPNMVADMITMMDNIVMGVVVEPHIHPIPLDDDGNEVPFGDPKRDPQLLYIDEVMMDDKQFIYQWAMGGTSDLHRFRQEQAQVMATVEAKPGVGATAKRASGAGKRS